MEKPLVKVLLISTFLTFAGSIPTDSDTLKKNLNGKEVSKFIEDAEAKLSEAYKLSVNANWNYNTNITDENEKVKLDALTMANNLKLAIGKLAKIFKIEDSNSKNAELRRKLKSLSNIGPAVLSEEKHNRFNQIKLDMTKIYSTAKVPDYYDAKKLLSYEPGLKTRMAESDNPKELEYIWNEWRAATGDKMRELYLEYIELTNEIAELNGYKDGTAYKTAEYESDTFVDEMAETWKGLKPLYQEIHAYVRHKLGQKYGVEVVPEDGPMPAHLLGNIWAQEWDNLANILQPYPGQNYIDVTKEMVRKGWTAKTMFEKADDFFQSLGLDQMTKTFWAKSMIERPSDGREVVCHASAWDFGKYSDFRIKQCTVVTKSDFITVNHEMGHVQYYMSYRNQSHLFRHGANPGFHEAVADITSLSVSTVAYMQQLGLIGNDIDANDYETDINILFETALQKLVFMPFGYLVDKYRWDMFSGVANEADLNCHWHKLRLDIQGISPSNKRSEENFDAGAKYHVAADVSYVRYFTAQIYQFQFYKELCLVAGQYVPGDATKPLHHCNLYGSKAAGKKLHAMMRLGSSKPWKEVMEVMTGSPDMDTAAFREYFAPLEKWLKEENRRNGVTPGWKSGNYEEYCS